MYGFTNWATGGIFVRFDPIKTFSDGSPGVECRMFIDSDGQPVNTVKDGVEKYPNLWRIGREAYTKISETLGTEIISEHFEWLAEEILDIEEQSSIWIQQLVEDGLLTIKEDIDAQPITDIVSYIQDPDYCEGWLLDTSMKIMKPLVVGGSLKPEDAPDYETLLYAVTLLWLDDALIAADLGQPDSMAMTIVQQSVASARLYREALEAATMAVSNLHRRNAKKRHAESHRQREALVAEWSKTKSEYTSRADFVRIVGKRENVKERTLDKWIASFEKG